MPVNQTPDWAAVTLLGGATTNQTGNQSSFGFDTPASNLDAAGLVLHLTGNSEFERAFIKAPNSSFADSDGVGPAFNSSACGNCHARDGRANFSLDILQAPFGQWSRLGVDAGIFLRTSLATGQEDCLPTVANRYCAPVAVPGFGTQLLHRGVLGLRTDSLFSGQVDVYVRFDTSTVAYADGTDVTLSRPVFQIRNPYDHPGEAPVDSVAPVSRVLQADVVISPRNGLPMFGLGLLEAVPEADILALADPDDADGDGISGRPNRVWDPVKARAGDPEPVSLGRFGWKASTPSVAVQALGAYRDDMGVTNWLFPDESIVGTPLYKAYLSSNPGDDGQAATGYEVSEDIARAVIFYSNTLAVPARRSVDDPAVMRGAERFVAAGCTACHHPTFRTGAHPGVPMADASSVGRPVTAASELAAVEHQEIHPFTDMLLHDMGDGLADGRTDFSATGREWRTRALWGIGLSGTVNPLAGYLHDGRARTLEEAILWHGGEAAAAQSSFRALPAADRAALLSFLGSL